MVAGGQHIRAQVEQILGELRRHAKAARRILGIDNHQIHVVRLAHMANVLAHNPAPRAAKNIADKKMFKSVIS